MPLQLLPQAIEQAMRLGHVFRSSWLLRRLILFRTRARLFGHAHLQTILSTSGPVAKRAAVLPLKLDPAGDLQAYFSAAERKQRGIVIEVRGGAMKSRFGSRFGFLRALHVNVLRSLG